MPFALAVGMGGAMSGLCSPRRFERPRLRNEQIFGRHRLSPLGLKMRQVPLYSRKVHRIPHFSIIGISARAVMPNCTNGQIDAGTHECNSLKD